VRGDAVVDVVVRDAGVVVAAEEAAGTRNRHGVVGARMHW
jgi:hypothetical protein